MTLEACVTSILCGLSRPVLTSLNTILTSVEVTIQAQLTAVAAQLAIINVALIPIEAAQAAAQAAVDTVLATANLVPLELIAGCADLGDLNVGLNDVLQATLADVNALLARAGRFLSLRDELQAIQQALSEQAALIGEIKLVIGACE